MNTNRWFAVMCIGGVLIVFTLFVVFDWQRNAAPVNRQAAVTKKPDRPPVEELDPIRSVLVKPGPDEVLEGGVIRKRSDLTKRETPQTSAPPFLPGPGKSPSLKADENSQVAGVMTALKEKSNPRRFNAFRSVEPFDEQAWRKDPQSYLAVVEPGRAFQTAQPSDEVPRLVNASRTYTNVIQGETVVLKVKGPKNAPVSFLSTKLGEFDNRLTAITIATDGEGKGEARFKATPGTQGNIEIMAASPLASGQARFIVNVTDPRSTGSDTSQESNND